MMHFPHGLRSFVSALASRFAGGPPPPCSVTPACWWIESVIRSCANDFLDPSNAGPNFTWLGTFPRYAERYAISQLWMGGVEPTRLHRSVARDIARKVAAEYALRDQDKAGLPLFGPATQDEAEWVDQPSIVISVPTDMGGRWTPVGPEVSAGREGRP